MSLNSRTTALVTATNLIIVAAVVFVVAVTKNPVAILGLFFLRDLPLFQDSINIEQLRQLGVLDRDDDGAYPVDDGYDRESKIGFTAQV